MIPIFVPWKCSHKKHVKMKKLTICLMSFSLLLLAVPVQLNAATLDINPVAADSITIAETAVVNTLTARLDELSLIDKASLRPAERREMRREVRSINKQLNAINNGGVYISVGTLLLIIILLVILL